MVESGTPWYGSMRLDKLNRTIPGRPGFNNSERSYSSAVGWARGRLACSPCTRSTSTEAPRTS
uniref:Uncharacterized protein n=1 Tax=Meloidogyne enterolobii TaxID=390850 RepID=A0A6V7TW78_MELEN|nr:unnamed protein product [Meloidogyne enterolobii]